MNEPIVNRANNLSNIHTQKAGLMSVLKSLFKGKAAREEAIRAMYEQDNLSKGIVSEQDTVEITQKDDDNENSQEKIVERDGEETIASEPLKRNQRKVGNKIIEFPGYKEKKTN